MPFEQFKQPREEEIDERLEKETGKEESEKEKSPVEKFQELERLGDELWTLVRKEMNRMEYTHMDKRRKRAYRAMSDIEMYLFNAFTCGPNPEAPEAEQNEMAESKLEDIEKMVSAVPEIVEERLGELDKELGELDKEKERLEEILRRIEELRQKL